MGEVEKLLDSQRATPSQRRGSEVWAWIDIVLDHTDAVLHLVVVELLVLGCSQGRIIDTSAIVI